ncbi:MAG: peptidoglycan DD-metalloendopeptidase family protein [Microcoleaceae cyanobacterium]
MTVKRLSIGGRFLKRTFPNRTNSIATSEFDTGANQEHSKQMNVGSNKACSSAAMIGLAAISTTMGASSILWSGAGDRVVAAELPRIDTNKDYYSEVATPGLDVATVNRQKGLLLQKLTRGYVEVEQSNDSQVGLTQPETILPSAQKEDQSFAPIELKQKLGQTKAIIPDWKASAVSGPQLNQSTKTDSFPPLGELAKPQVKKALSFSAQSDTRLTEEFKATINPNPAEKHKNRQTQSSIESRYKADETVSESLGKSSQNNFKKNIYQTQNNVVVEEPQLQITSKVDNNSNSKQFTSNQPEIAKESIKGQGTKVEGAVVIDSEMTSTPVSVVYKVRVGETLGLIASQHGVSTEALAAINQINDPNVIEVAQLLKIPQQSFSQSLTLAKSTIVDSKFSQSNISSKQQSSSGQFSQPSMEATSYEAQLPKTKLPIIESDYLSDKSIPSVSLPTGKNTNSLQLVSWSQDVGNKDYQTNQPKEFPASTLLSVTSESPKTPLVNGKVWPNSLESNISEPNYAVEVENNIPLGNGQPDRTPAVEKDTTYTQQLPVTRNNNRENPYANRLRGEIIRLRQEYDAQKESEESQPLNAQSIPISVPQPLSSEKTLSTNPNISYNTDSRYLQKTYQEETSRPQIRQLSENMRTNRRNTGNTTTVVEVPPLESQNNKSQQLDLPVVMATAPTGANADDILNNPSLGKMVSPDLPPLDRADTYLPGGSMQFTGYSWPSRGALTSGYGWRWGRMHRGIDIAAPTGTPIVSAAPGVVTFADWSSGGYGYLVEIEHPNGSLTIYAHNSQILVREGQKVAQGELIAKMGSTGRSTGPHLHFEIHPTGNGAVNPMAYLPSGVAYN